MGPRVATVSPKGRRRVGAMHRSGADPRRPESGFRPARPSRGSRSRGGWGFVGGVDRQVATILGPSVKQSSGFTGNEPETGQATFVVAI